MSWNPLEYFQLYPYEKSYPLPRLYEILNYDYAVFGACALRKYLPERKTYSLDVLIHADCAEHIHKELLPHTLEDDYFSGTHRFYILKSNKQYLTTISLDAPWVESALNTSKNYLDSNEPSLPFEWLILTKMTYGKRQDFMDCARLIARASKHQFFDTKELLEKWMPSAIPELRKLYSVGNQELEKAPGDKPKYRNEATKYTSWHHMSASHLQYLEPDWETALSGEDKLDTPFDWPERPIN